MPDFVSPPSISEHHIVDLLLSNSGLRFLIAAFLGPTESTKGLFATCWQLCDTNPITSRAPAEVGYQWYQCRWQPSKSIFRPSPATHSYCGLQKETSPQTAMYAVLLLRLMALPPSTFSSSFAYMIHKYVNKQVKSLLIVVMKGSLFQFLRYRNTSEDTPLLVASKYSRVRTIRLILLLERKLLRDNGGARGRPLVQDVDNCG